MNKQLEGYIIQAVLSDGCKDMIKSLQNKVLEIEDPAYDNERLYDMIEFCSLVPEADRNVLYCMIRDVDDAVAIVREIPYTIKVREIRKRILESNNTASIAEAIVAARKIDEPCVDLLTRFRDVIKSGEVMWLLHLEPTKSHDFFLEKFKQKRSTSAMLYFLSHANISDDTKREVKRLLLESIAPPSIQQTREDKS